MKPPDVLIISDIESRTQGMPVSKKIVFDENSEDFKEASLNYAIKVLDKAYFNKDRETLLERELRLSALKYSLDVMTD